MPRRQSAGLIMYRIKDGLPEIFLAHPGGPYFNKKDDGHWSIPKGEPDEGEQMLVTAMREFKEETGITPVGEFLPLGSIIQKGGKEVHVWAFESDLPVNYVHTCNFFEEEWPPHSGEYREFPEVDKVGFFSVEEAKQKIKAAQIPLIDKLLEYLKSV
ncbi:MAG TPA: NUDIX domain-containing protein [Ignavibacteria bacterium]|nr:NUDIX domain-containing protein [Ignavibacteria bacterium]